jgi:hypothetical protein
MPLVSNIHQHTNDQPICAICSEPVNLKTAKTDENGQAVHEECYLRKLLSKDGGFRRMKDKART